MSQNEELYNEVIENYQKNIDAESLVKILPEYAKCIMTNNNNDDLILEIILNNVMNLKMQNKYECKFLVPIFVPTSLNEEQFYNLYYSLYHLDENEEQMNLLIDLFVNEFGSDENGILFDYFVNVGFPNLFQNFISINYCKKAESVINSLILISQKNEQAINLTTHILSKFILSSYPFMQEFRNYFTQETLFVGKNGLNQNIKDPFINSFKYSIGFLSEPHISALKSFFDNLPGYKEKLIDLIFNGIITNVKNMHQFLTKELILTANDVTDDIKNMIEDFKKEKCSSIPNIDEVFYNNKKRISFTHADIFILSKISQKLGKGSIFSDPNEQIPDISMDSAFTIIRDFIIKNESEVDKPTVENSNNVNEVDQKNINKWEAIKDEAASKLVDPLSLIDLKKEDAEGCLKVILAQFSGNEQLQNKIRERMKSINYIKQVKDLINQMNSELLNHFARKDPSTPQKKSLFFKQRTKSQLFLDNFLNCYLAQYSRDSEGKLIPLKQEIKINSSDSIEKCQDLKEFTKNFTNIQYKILIDMCEANEKSVQNQKYTNAPTYESLLSDNMIMINWLHKLLNYEKLLNIILEEKEDKTTKFNEEVNIEIIEPFYRDINLLKFINDEMNEEAIKPSSNKKKFTGIFISNFVLIVNEFYKDILQWEADYEEIKSKDDQDDFVDLFDVNVADIIFSSELNYGTFLRILDDLIGKVPNEYRNALEKIKTKFEERKINKK